MYVCMYVCICSFSDDDINLLKISPFSVIPGDIKTVYMLYGAVHVISIL